MPLYSITESASGSGDNFISLPPRSTPVSVAVNGSAGTFTAIPGIGLTITFPAVSNGDVLVTTYNDEPPVAPSGGGSAFSNGDGIDQTQTVSSETRVFDIRGKSRPVMLNFIVASGDQLDMFTSTDPAALTDADHPSWTEERAASSFSVIEVVGSPSVVGIRIRRTAGSGTSTVRIYAPLRGPGYNPVYDPSYDVSPAGLNDTRRFLDQATMGALPLEAASFSGTYGAWIDAQIAAPSPTLEPIPAGLNAQNNALRGMHMSQWKLWAEAPSTQQLRIRTAYALGQIVVAGMAQPASGSPNMITWQQGLLDKAFSNYRDILRHACMNRTMGWFLNNVGNRAKNIAPSQNFARELLQLFSTGTQLLNKDGSVQLDSSGSPIPAYTQQDVAAAARYLSGWAQRGAVVANPGQNGTPVNGDMETGAAVGGVSLDLAFNGFDTGPGAATGTWNFFGKGVADYPSFAAFAVPTDQQIIDRRDAILDVIMQQPSVGPYVCKQLIQKMVTDNPTPQYIRRVVAAWDNNGSGVVGDLAAVVRAILLDAEARGNSKPVTFGRAQEWTLANTRRCRYAQWVPVDIVQAQGHMWSTAELGSPPPSIMPRQGQTPASPISVFNDYPFQYSLGDTQAPAAALWTAPALQANIGITPGWSNAAHLANPTVMANLDVNGRWLATELIAVYDAAFAADPGDATAKALAGHNALIDKVYPDMHQGDMPTTDERTPMLTFLTTLHSQSIGTRSKCCWLVNLVLATARSAVVQ